MNRELRKAMAGLRRHIRAVLLEQADKRDLPLTSRNVDDLADDLFESIQSPKVTVPSVAGPLTHVQREVLHGCAIGETSAETARRLCVSETTVTSHKRKVYARLGVHTAPEAVAMGIGLGLLRVDKRAAFAGQLVVDGPFRVSVSATPAGAALDVSHYLTSVLLNLAAAAEEDGEGLLAELVEVAELARSAQAQGRDSHAAHERDERAAALLAEVADDGVIPVYGPQVGRLADRLREIAAPRPVPSQREAGAA
ncbi:helix-turn-helix transcriptional regulator [Streptomyces sp. NPDC002506]|uniref:helix-turn-helix transcriptional regulator n=1 Tax=Streptomyces sp. NPDC002506 TaxID=3154536 RepID=UPI0033293F69